MRTKSFIGLTSRLALALGTLIALTAGCASWVHATNFATTTLQAGMHVIQAEIADDTPKRMQGLMYRRELPGNRGMVFVFPQPTAQCMWMKNTLIPLSVAFIDNNRRIINIEDMQPQSETQHCAKAEALYALEMPLGWFARKGIREGDRIEGLDALRGR